jgi:tRNA modification GTPase
MIEWKEIKEHPNYLVSNNGEVFSKIRKRILIPSIDKRKKDGFINLEEYIEKRFSIERHEGLLVTNSRHLVCLNNSMEILKETIDAINNNITIDIIAEGLRSSGRELSEILGINYSEDLLDRIFAKFCIGK